MNLDTLPPLPDPPTEASTPASPKRRRWIVLCSILLCASLIIIAGWNHVALLEWGGNLLVVQPDLQPAEAIVLLGGGGVIRAEHAVNLMREGMAERLYVLLPEAVAYDAPNEDINSYESQFVAALVDRSEIQRTDVQWSKEIFLSTYDEIVHLHEWCIENEIRKAIVVTGWYQSARAQWCIDRIFEKTDVALIISPAPQPSLRERPWWQHEETLILVQNEWLKHGYYRLQALRGVM